MLAVLVVPSSFFLPLLFAKAKSEMRCSILQGHARRTKQEAEIISSKICCFAQLKACPETPLNKPVSARPAVFMSVKSLEDSEAKTQEKGCTRIRGLQFVMFQSLQS